MQRYSGYLWTLESFGYGCARTGSFVDALRVFGFGLYVGGWAWFGCGYSSVGFEGVIGVPLRLVYAVL